MIACPIVLKEFQNGFPIGELITAIVDELALKFGGTVFLTVVNEEIAAIQLFVVGKNKPFVGYIAKVLLHPNEFVRP